MAEHPESAHHGQEQGPDTPPGFWHQVGYLISGILFITIVAGGGLSYFTYDYFKSPGPLAAEENVYVPSGSGLKKIAAILAERSVIKYPDLFVLVGRYSQAGSRLQAGEYAFSPHITPLEIYRKMLAGETVVHMVTIPEGLMTSQILALLKDTPGLSGEVPVDVREGELLPETYSYHYNDTRAGIVERMRKDMHKTVLELWENRDPSVPFSTPKEALTMASIVEKETSVKAERQRVAAVFINRLKKRMRLQSDPTTIYAITQGLYQLDRPLTSKDLQMASPYNTYVTDGLPPSPIANPGKASIEAVLHPLQTTELYFVADGSGGHKFASTLAEHNKNVQAWRKINATQAQ